MKAHTYFRIHKIDIIGNIGNRKGDTGWKGIWVSRVTVAEDPKLR